MDDSLRRRALAARIAIRQGTLRGAALLELLLAVPFLDRDGWTDELLGIDQPPPDDALPRGSVPYLPSGVEEILAMVREVPMGDGDELVDLGSGLGRVVFLAHLLTGATARGIEIQAQLVHRAQERGAALDLARVSFVCANVADAVLDGSVFFLYAPCNGKMLTEVLARLEEVARRRPIVVCTVGLEFRDVPWLRPRRTTSVSLAVYDAAPARVVTPGALPGGPPSASRA